MSDVSMMGSTASAYTWQRPGDTPSMGGMIGRLLDITAAGWVAKFASGAGSERPSGSDQGLVSGGREGVLAASPRDRHDLMVMASAQQQEIAIESRQGRERGLNREHLDREMAASLASRLAELNQGERAFAEPKRQNVARKLTPAEKQALDEYVSQGKPPEQRAKAAERIACFIGSNASALSLGDLGLTRLPDIVKTLRLDTLDVSGNKLEELALPAEVAYLRVSNNALTAMPVLPEGTRMVFAEGNLIREFHGPLPGTLSQVDARDNILDALPPFPASMVRFDIGGNTGRLTQADADAKLCSPVGAQRVHIHA